MTYRFNQTMFLPNGSVSSDISVDGDAEVSLVDQAVAVATDTLVNVAFPYATIKAVILLCDVALTIKTNSSGAPSQTISLAAGVPTAWITGGAGANPFSVDVTKIYLTAVTAGTLNIRVLYDPTP
jgi:hypothetical protein